MFNERQIIQQIRQGDRTAFSALVQQYQKLVFHMVQRVVQRPQDVEDVSQEVFIKVYNRLDTFAFESTLATWIARIAYLTAIDSVRKVRSNPLPVEPAMEQLFCTDETPEQALIRTDMTSYLQQLIAHLPESYRIVLTLYHLEEFSYLEIEHITGMPIGTVKNYLFRARKLLKGKLADSLTDDLR